MFVSPINFIASFGLVPIFQWEPVEPAAGDAPAPPPVSINSVGSEPQQQPSDTSSPQMRLVFKGFGWAPGVDIATYPRPNWMSGLAASGAEELTEKSDRLDDERRARAIEAAKQYAAVLAAHIAAASLLDPSSAATPPSETSES